jgi:diguanylate cyclase
MAGVSGDKFDEAVNTWIAICDEAAIPLQDQLYTMICARAENFAELFYDMILQDSQTAKFLTQVEVQQRLHASMVEWLKGVFVVSKPDEVRGKVERQLHVGKVHARLQVPVSVVAKSAGKMKQVIARDLQGSDLQRNELAKVICLVYELFDHAIDIMNEAYIENFESQTRNDESYRRFAVGQNIVAERERLRACLLGWERGFLLHANQPENCCEMQKIGASEFGLWFRHKAMTLFKDATEIQEITLLISKIDDDLLLKVQQRSGDVSKLVNEIDETVAGIMFMFSSMFDRFLEVENGRDDLTHLLNRRFLPSVLSREISMSIKTGNRFAIMLIDLDHFKRVNDTWGHSIGDTVLKKAADIIRNSLRIGDFVFRYGGEEIMVVLVEVNQEIAMNVAENLRTKFEAFDFSVNGNKITNLTVSVGIALHEGHPDYERLINAADDAMYHAKKNGRNQCVLAKTD